MKKIPLSKGLVALVDDEDYDWLTEWAWHALKTGADRNTFYANRSIWSTTKPGGRTSLRMHRQIMGVTDRRIEVDHANGNGLDNQRHNLRLATRGQNAANQRRHRDNLSGFKGVHWHEGRWVAHIGVDYKTIQLGGFDTPEEAARAYDEGAKKYHGEFAHLSAASQTEEAENG